MKATIGRFLVTLGLLTALLACGGGGGGAGGGGGGGGTEPGIDRLGVKAGVVTGFGSIFVSGEEFETNDAQFDIDDDATSSGQDDLNIGDTVIVTFDPDVSSNLAQTVFSDDAVEGPIDSIAASMSSLVVAGQTVNVDAATSFDESIPTASLAGLAVGDFIEVNGFFDADGGIRATRIEPGAGEVEVHGFVTGLAAGEQTFSINALMVDYGVVPAVIDDSFPNGAFANGDFVEVRGTIGAGGELRATKVEADGPGVDDSGFDDFDEIDIELEGFITRFVSSSDFDVSGLPVTTTGSTVYENGVAGDLGLNVKVEVDGELDASGALVAARVDIRRVEELRVVALVDSVDAAGGTLVVLGIAVGVDAATRREDKSDAHLEPFGLADLNPGDYVEVRGGADPSNPGGILAGLLEREDVPGDLNGETELRGFAESATNPSFTIAGVTIETNGETVFRDAAEMPMSAGEFFAALQDGDLVDVSGTETAQTTIVADEVELEN